MRLIKPGEHVDLLNHMLRHRYIDPTPFKAPKSFKLGPLFMSWDLRATTSTHNRTLIFRFFNWEYKFTKLYHIDAKSVKRWKIRQIPGAHITERSSNA